MGNHAGYGDTRLKKEEGFEEYIKFPGTPIDKRRQLQDSRFSSQTRDMTPAVTNAFLQNCHIPKMILDMYLT